MLLAAPLIHDGYRFLPEGSVLEVGDDGSIVAIHLDYKGEDAIPHEGILCPGLVNVHCHLELSHMHGIIPERTGLIPFLQTVTKHRADFTEEQVKAARHEAYAELLRNGVVAVGDIANTTDTMDLRAIGKLHMHSFIECIGFTQSHAQQRFDYSSNIWESFAAQQTKSVTLWQSIVPHAPYSVSESLFQLIDGHSAEELISIHNQESEAENDYYQNKTGDVRSLLEGFGIDDGFFEATGKTSLISYGEWLSPSHPMLLVHNTVSKAADIAYAKGRFSQLSFALCPNANLYIEGRLPDIPMLQEQGVNLCIGTDSLASNWALSVLGELRTIRDRHPAISWETLLQWGTINGAKALQMDGTIGSFEPGKKPAVVNIKAIDGEAMIQRIV